MKLICALLVSFLLAAAVPARAEGDRPAPFKMKCKAAVLVNVISGQVIASQNADELIPPASLTKLMTLCLVYDAVDNGYVKLTDPVKISEKAWKTTGSKMFLEVNSSVDLETLVKGIAVVSANDACVAVSEYIAGIEDVFVEKMNRKAAELEMKNTVYKNSHGLPIEGQHTTARDVARLGVYYLKNYPEVLRIHSMKELTYNKITQRNRNGLLWLDAGVDGLKTGWFSAAGYHIAATAYQNGGRFLAVVMGARSERQRENIALQLLNYGFRNFKTVEVLPARKELVQASVWKGSKGSLSLGFPQAVHITIPRDATEDIYIEKDFPEKVFAPVARGDEIGRLRILLGGEQIKVLPLVALEDIEPAGLLKGLFHGAVLFFILPPYWGGIILAALLAVFVTIELLSLRKKKRKKSNIDLDGLFGR